MFILRKICTTLAGDVDLVGEAVSLVGWSGEYMRTLYFLLNFAVNLNLLQKKQNLFFLKHNCKMIRRKTGEL